MDRHVKIWARFFTYGLNFSSQSWAEQWWSEAIGTKPKSRQGYFTRRPASAAEKRAKAKWGTGHLTYPHEVLGR